MGVVIQLRERVPVPVTKNRIVARIERDRQRAMAHAQMMMLGAMLTTGVMMLGLVMLVILN